MTAPDTKLDRGDDGTYAEITRLNNDLVNAQRQLAQRNAELLVLTASLDATRDPEEEMLHSVALQNASSIVRARRRAHEELIEAKEQLRERIARRSTQLQAANQELESLAYSMAHDLRAPARQMDALAALLEEACASTMTPRQLSWLGMMRASSQRQAAMIDDVVAYLRLGTVPLDRGPVDMNAEAATAVAQARIQKGEGRADWVVGDLPPAHGDRTLVRAIFAQLVANALKFSALEPQPVIELGAECVGEELAYFVRDNGVGFDPARAGNMFKLFERMHGESQFGGSGLGLALVRRLVSRLRGRTWARSAPGEGATFYFTLGSALR